MLGDLPPSSSDTRCMLDAAARMIACPVRVDPGNGRWQGSVVAQQRDRALLGAARGSNRSSHVERVQQGELLEVRFHQVSEPKQNCLPLKRLETAPGPLKSASRGADGQFHVFDT